MAQSWPRGSQIAVKKRTPEDVDGNFKIYIYKIDSFAGFCEQIFKKYISEDILGKIDEKVLSRLADFGC